MKRGELCAGRFKIEAFVGEGGMGEVYRAVDLQTGEAVALKHVRASQEGEARFFREARALAALTHPGIVRYVAHGTTENGELYLAMEWLEGETLAARLARQPLEQDESIELARRIASALGHAHAQGIVHRDLNPSNLLIVGGRVEWVKVLDFGLARLRGDRTETTTKWDAPMGTIGYMAPEQARGAGDSDSRADLFSLGCVLFECLTGRPAFGADNYLAVLAKIVVARAPRVRDFLPEAPGALDRLVDQLLAKDPDDRPPNADAVIDALNGLGGSRPSLRTASGTHALALTTFERMLVSVIVAQSNVNGGEPGTTSRRLDRASATAGRFGVRADRLADGTLVMISSGSGAAKDHVARAARAALAVAEELAPIEVAMATGWAIVAGTLPSGDVVDRAVTLLRAARPGELRIDDASAGLLPPRFRVSGDAQSLVVLGEREDEQPLRLLLGKSTPCVGRDRELRTLHAIIDESVVTPMAHAVLLTGPAGVGKSRVRYELLGQIAQRHPSVEVWLGRGDPMRAGSPFSIVAHALRNALGLAEGEPAPIQQRKLVARVARHVPEAERSRVAEFLGELLGVSFDDVQSVRLRAARQDPMLMGDQIRQALEDFLDVECHAHPLVLVLEDLQWGDAATVKLIDGALRHLSEQPFTVLAVGRPDVHEMFPGLWSDRTVQEIRVGALTRRAAEALVRELLGSVEPAVLGDIVARAGGNAFYLEELIRAHTEGRGDRLPDTVLGMVKERIEAMEPEARRVLRAASVFGQSFWPGGVAELLGGESMQREVGDWLRTLEQREVVQRRPESTVPGEAEYAFRHSLVRDSAYAMLTDDDRPLGHRLAAGWLTTHGVRDGVLIAEHYERSGDRESALAFWYEAARDALDANDFDSAVSRAARGLASGASGERAAAFELVHAEASRLRGDVIEAYEFVRRAIEGYEPGTLGWCNAMSECAVELQRLGRASELERTSDALLEVSVRADAVDSLAMARVRTAILLLRIGSRTRARELVSRAEAESRMPGLVTRAWTHAFHGIDALLEGDRAKYLAEITSAISCHDAVGDVRPALEHRIGIGSLYFELGAWTEAEKTLSDALAHAERLGLSHAKAGAQHNLGLVLANLGRFDEALALERKALDRFRDLDRRMQGGTELAMAMISELQGDYAAAEEQIQPALETLREAAPPLVPAALGLWASLLLREGDVQAALDHAREAHQALEAGGVEYGDTLIRRVYAEALARSGDRAEAERVVAVGRRRLLDEAARFEDGALRRSLLENVRDNARLLALANEWEARDEPA